MHNKSDIATIKQSCMDYYNHLHASYYEKYHNDLEHKAYDKEFLQRFVGQIPAKGKILDIGCGSSAQQAHFFRDMGFKVTAIDLSEKCIETAKQMFTGITFRKMDMLEMDFETNAFDAINAFYSFIHIPDEKTNRIFSQSNRVLKTNGIMAIAVYANDFYGYYNKNDIPVFYRTYSQAGLIKLLSQHGFEIIDIEERQAIYDFEFQCERIYLTAKKKNADINI